MAEINPQEPNDPRLTEYLERLRKTPERNPQVAQRNRQKYLAELDAYPFADSPQSFWERLLSGLRSEIGLLMDKENKLMNSRKGRIALTVLAALIIGFVFLFSGSAVTVLAAQSAIPGDALYPVKTSLEQTRLTLARDAAARAELQLRFAEIRLTEIKTLIAEGRFQNIQAANLAFDTHIQNALSEIDIIASGNPTLAAELMNRIKDSLSRYASTLGELVNNVPEPVKGEMQRTIRAIRGASGNGNANENPLDNQNQNSNLNVNEALNENENANINSNDDGGHGRFGKRNKPSANANDNTNSSPPSTIVTNNNDRGGNVTNSNDNDSGNFNSNNNGNDNDGGSDDNGNENDD